MANTLVGIVRSSIFRFRDLGLARSFANRGRALAVVMGDAPYFWVVTLTDADRLIQAGYELA